MLNRILIRRQNESVFSSFTIRYTSNYNCPILTKPHTLWHIHEYKHTHRVALVYRAPWFHFRLGHRTHRYDAYVYACTHKYRAALEFQRIRYKYADVHVLYKYPIIKWFAAQHYVRRSVFEYGISLILYMFMFLFHLFYSTYRGYGMSPFSGTINNKKNKLVEYRIVP